MPGLFFASAARIRRALQQIAPEQLVISIDCGFGRQVVNREIAFFKTTAIARGTINRDRRQAVLLQAERPARHGGE